MNECDIPMYELVKDLVKKGILRTEYIIEAFEDVDRADFLLPEDFNRAYEDYPISIGYGQTNSQPTTVAFMIELLQPRVGEKILDVGAGSGWTTAILAYIVGPKGFIYGVERIPALVEFGNKNINKYGSGNAKIVVSGPKLGLESQSPYDRILVSASAEELPRQLVDQLKVDGTMVIPIGNSIFKVYKQKDGSISKQEYPGFVFVPLLK